MAYDVTIGIPVYNVEKYIRLTMESALAQTHKSIEFLVLDDCGNDKSIEIIRGYKETHPRGRDIRIVRQPQNGGIGRARNRIIEEAQGKYLYYLDADDAIAPNAIELLYENAKRYDADIVYGSYEKIEEFDNSESKTLHRYPSLQFLKENDFADFVYNHYSFLQANTWNFLIKTDIYLKNGICYQPINFWEDFATTIDLPCYVTRVVLLPDITYYYYCRYGSLSKFEHRVHIDKNEIQKTIDAMAVLKRNSNRLKAKPYFHKRMYKVLKTHFFMACTIIKEKKKISPKFTYREIRDLMRSPLSFKETIGLKGWRFYNFSVYLLGVLPPFLSVAIISIVGWRKRLV